MVVALLVGVTQTGITLLRLGDLSRYISQAVVVGFTLGAAVLLVLDQLKNLLGLPPLPAGEASEHFLIRFGQSMAHVGEVNWWAVAIGAGTILVVLLLRRVSARLGRRLPELLIAVVAAAALVWALDLDAAGVRTIGAVPRSLPHFALPEVSVERVRGLAGGALAIALLGLLEAIAMAKAIAAHTGQKLDINQQCLSEGLANMTGSLFHCFPGSGSLTRSAINQQAGAVSQWSGVIAAAAVAATVLLFAPAAHFIPRAALAGVLILSAARLVDRKQLLYHLRATRFDAAHRPGDGRVGGGGFRRVLHPHRHLPVVRSLRPPGGPAAPDRADAHAGAGDPRAPARRPALRPHASLQPGRRPVLRLGPRPGGPLRRHREADCPRRSRGIAAPQARCAIPMRCAWC